MKTPSCFTRTQLIINSLPATAMGFALCVQISALSWLLSTKYKLEIHEIGIVWAAGPLAGMFGQILIGIFSDRAWLAGGRRRPFILVAGILSSLSLYLLTRLDKLADTLAMADLVVVAGMVALVLDLSINVGLNPARALIADVTTPGEQRTQGFSWMQSISGFWGVVAYLVGAFIGNEFLIYAGCIIVLVFSAASFLIQEKPDPAAVGNTFAARSKTTEWRELWKIWAAHGFTWFGIQPIFVYLIAFVQAYLVPHSAHEAASTKSGQIVAVSFAIMNIVGFIVPAFALSRAAIRFGRVKVHATCVATLALSCFGIALFARSEVTLYLFMAFAGIGWGAVISLPFAIMSEKIDERRTGYFMGVFNLTVVIPQLATTQIGFLLSEGASRSSLFLICGTSLSISAVMWILVKERKYAGAHAERLAAGSPANA